jgi:MYXO-CTERM domain-containing protein
MNRLYVLPLSLAVGLQAVSASATGLYTSVAYTTLDSAGNYNAYGGTSIGGPSPQGHANQFVPAIGGLLSSIEIGVTYVNAPELVDVQLRQDNGNGFPYGTILASSALTVTTPFGLNGTSLVEFAPSTPVTLATDTAYWLILLPHSGSSFDVWNDSFGTYGPIGSTTDGGATWGIGPPQLQNAFRVNVVPEPSSLALGVLGLGGLACLRRRA